MAIPHLSVKLISRSAGQSAIASASYRAGEVLHDDRIGRTFDYSRKEDVLHKEILAPEAAPAWVTDRQYLWNQVEACEKRKDAQLARSFILALPRELTRDQGRALVRDFAWNNFVNHGMIADICIHEADASDGGKNPHAHIMLTLRDISSDGFGQKNREWNNPNLVTAWRESWEQFANTYLEKAESEARLSMRSYTDQGLEREPQIHMGPEAWYMEQRGIETRRGDKNREIARKNAEKDAEKQQEIPPGQKNLGKEKFPMTDREREQEHFANRLSEAAKHSAKQAVSGLDSNNFDAMRQSMREVSRADLGQIRASETPRIQENPTGNQDAQGRHLGEKEGRQIGGGERNRRAEGLTLPPSLSQTQAEAQKEAPRQDIDRFAKTMDHATKQNLQEIGTKLQQNGAMLSRDGTPELSQKQGQGKFTEKETNRQTQQDKDKDKAHER